MIKINLIAVGKVKEKYFADGIEEYKKRLQGFCDFKITEVEEENYKKIDEKLILSVKEKEGERIKKFMKGYVIGMAIEGKKCSSEQFAKLLKTLIDKGQNVTFIIGGSYGIADGIKEECDELMSFSDMTFPHTMFRLMLTEQIYRAFGINSGSAYHK